MNVRSFAKINLGLEVVGKRTDGYHDIRTLFQSVDLSDDLEIESAPADEIRLSGDDPTVAWDGTNLIHRAARMLQSESPERRGAAIRVTKRVPAGRGLGGGSANAAVTLLALNAIWGLGLGTERLAGLAEALGADVPYFLHGGLCLGEGKGERLSCLRDLPVLPCVLVFPPFPIATASIYAGLGVALTSTDKVSKINRFLETGDFGLLENDLENVIFRRYPELEGIKRFFRSQGAVLSLVSGSGSAVFGLFTARDEARQALARIGAKSAALLVDTLPRDGYGTRVGAGV